MTLANPLVLASRSPRRRAILAQLGLTFEVVASEVAEVRGPGEAPESYARRLSRDKALEVAGRLAAPAWVIAADTIVVEGGAVLEKPCDDDDARAMIARLSGRSHDVITAVALALAPGIGNGDDAEKTHVDQDAMLREVIAVVTGVRFRALSAAEIDGYVATGEGRDKAGAYGAQGIGAGLIEAVKGSYYNVIGLPAAETITLLTRHGALRAWP